MEAQLFTWKEADKYDEDWVGIDLVTARRLGRNAIDAFRVFQEFPILP